MLSKKKNIIILILVVILAISFIILLFYFLRKNSVQNNILNQNKKEEVAQQNNEYINKICSSITETKEKNTCFALEAEGSLDIDKCSLISDKENQVECKDKVRCNKAIQNKDFNLCNDISLNSIFQYCVLSVMSLLDYTKEQCPQLNEKQKNVCIDKFLSDNAKNENNILLCDEIILNNDKTECYRNIIYKQSDINFCKDLQDNWKKECVLTIVSKLFNEKNDISICKEAEKSELKDLCLYDINIITDIDQDYLSNEDEKKYGTDPNNPDTDGDGYSDGDEVKAGYNPKGEGKIK